MSNFGMLRHVILAIGPSEEQIIALAARSECADDFLAEIQQITDQDSRESGGPESASLTDRDSSTIRRRKMHERGEDLPGALPSVHVVRHEDRQFRCACSIDSAMQCKHVLAVRQLISSHKRKRRGRGTC